jgi:predicted ATPase
MGTSSVPAVVTEVIRMLQAIHFKNVKALRDTALPLGRFTLLLGPNGSGKSTVLQTLKYLSTPSTPGARSLLSVGADPSAEVSVVVDTDPKEAFGITEFAVQWGANGQTKWAFSTSAGPVRGDAESSQLTAKLSTLRVYSLDGTAIIQAVQLQPQMELGSNGSGLAGVLEKLRDEEPERFEALNKETSHWLPEYDRILLDTPQAGQKAFLMRTQVGRHKIPAGRLSQGTVLALAMLTLAYLPNPPALIGLEEPDRGLHPRLLRDLRDALYRLSHPESCGESRPPVQVIVTTHSPYMLDLYRDHPEEVVLAEKQGLDVRFKRLADMPHFEEILGDAPLSEVWYSGILGGVPAAP